MYHRSADDEAHTFSAGDVPEQLESGSKHRLAFATLLRRYRDMAGLTQEELADRAGLSVRTISDLERGLKQTPRHSTLALLVRALDLSDQERAQLEAAVERRRGPAPAPTPVPLDRAGRFRDLPLVGRGDEMEMITAWLREPVAELLLLTGEPGIGKSRLLTEAARHALALGWTVVQGGCRPSRIRAPFAPLDEALASYLETLSSVQRRQVLRGTLGLERLLSPYHPAGSSLDTGPAEMDRRWLFAEVRRLTSSIASSMGTLLVLDDLQWAGPDAAELIAELVSHRGSAESGGRVRMLAASRGSGLQPGETVSDLLGGITGRTEPALLPLSPLSPAHASALLDLALETTKIDETARASLIERTGGVPFFIVSSVREAQAADGVERSGLGLPWTIANSVRHRLADLPGPAKTVLEVAAVAGRVVERTMLADVSRYADLELVGALEAACRADLLLEAGTGGYAFAHDVVREAVQADMSTARLAHLHAVIAGYLERAEPGELDEIAFHYAASDRREKALHHLERAGDAARARFAYTAAEAYYRRVLSLLPGGEPGHTEARLLARLGLIQFRRGQLDAARDTLLLAVRAARAAGNAGIEGRAATDLGDVYKELHQPAEGMAVVRATLGHYERMHPCPLPPEAHAWLYEQLSWLYSAVGSPEQQLSAAERALRIITHAAPGHDRDDVALMAGRSRGHALMELGDIAGVHALENLLHEAQVSGFVRPQGYLLDSLAGAYLSMGRLRDCVAAADRGLRIMRATEELSWEVLFAVFGGWARFMQGNWPDAADRMTIALDRAREADHAGRATLLALLVWLKAVQGQYQVAGSYLSEASPLVATMDDPWESARLAAASGMLRILQGNPRAAVTALDPVAGVRGVESALYLPILVEACLAAGESERADRVSQRGLQQAERFAVALPDALRVRAAVLRERGNAADTTPLLQRGIDLARAMPYPFGEARLWHEWMLTADELQDREQQAMTHAHALDLFQQLGAQPFIDEMGTSTPRC